MRDIDLFRILTALSNPNRLMILNFLREGPASFMKLMRMCGYDPRRQCGNLVYHLKKLLDVGLITRKGDCYTLSEEGLRLLEIIDEVRRKELNGGADLDESKLIVKEFKQEDVEFFINIFPERVREDVIQFVHRLVSGSRSSFRVETFAHALRLWGIEAPKEVISSLEEERLSWIALYEDRVVGFLTSLVFNSKPFLNIRPKIRRTREERSKLEELIKLVEAKGLALSVITAIWASPEFNRRKVVNSLLSAAMKRFMEKNVLQIQFTFPKKEMVDLLSEHGFLTGNGLYIGLNSFKSKTLCDELAVDLGFLSLPLTMEIVYMAGGGRLTAYYKYPEVVVLWLP